MAQADGIVSNASGAAVRADLNNQLAALFTNHSGATEPSTTYAYQMWADIGSTPAVMKLRDSSNSSWITLYKLDGTSLPTSSATEIAFNDAGADIDFRIEGDTDANLFFIDAGNDRAGIGTASPSEKLDVSGTGDIKTVIQTTSTGSGANAALRLKTGDYNYLLQTGDAVDGGIRFWDSTAAAERARIDSSGNVGIATTSPSTRFHLTGTDNNFITLDHATRTGKWIIEHSGVDSQNLVFQQNNGTSTANSYLVGRDTHQWYISNDEKVRIDGSGNVCIGTTSIGNINGYSQLAFNGTSGGIVHFKDDDTEVARIVGTTSQLTLRTIDSSGTIRLETQSTERVRVANDGSVVMGAITTSNAPADVNSRIYYYSNNNSTSGQLFIDSRKSDAFVSVNQSYADTGNRGAIAFYRSEYYKGQISISSTQVYYNTTSDYRLKENIVDVTGGINLVKQLQPRSFNFINEPSETIMGFVAHEVETVVPNAVSGTKDGLQIWEEGEELPDGFSVGDNKLDENGDTIPDYQCLDQAKLVPVLTAALKEAIAKIETLEAKVAALESA